jgi:exopolyphosphatase/guanosine-5'-triphosphate,3'-diphosphate pyrophosphatase
MRVAVLDLGSNTFHLLLAQVDSQGGIHKLGSFKRTLRLGAEIPPGAAISEDPWQRAMDAIEELLSLGRPFECSTVAVATSVFRVRTRFGISVDLLTGAEEGRLSYLGAMSEMPRMHGPVAVIDVGGGSIQMTVGEGDRCRFAASLPLGVLRLSRAAAEKTTDAREAATIIADMLRREANLAADAVSECNPRRSCSRRVPHAPSQHCRCSTLTS